MKKMRIVGAAWLAMSFCSSSYSMDTHNYSNTLLWGALAATGGAVGYGLYYYLTQAAEQDNFIFIEVRELNTITRELPFGVRIPVAQDGIFICYLEKKRIVDPFNAGHRIISYRFYKDLKTDKIDGYVNILYEPGERVVVAAEEKPYALPKNVAFRQAFFQVILADLIFVAAKDIKYNVSFLRKLEASLYALRGNY